MKDTKKIISALEVAKFFLSLDTGREYFVSDKQTLKLNGISVPTLGNFRLNKLLHITQILHCAKYGEYLFSDPLMAFEHGGIVYDIYRRFHFLVKEFDVPKKLDSSHQHFLTKIYHSFQSYNNKQLEDFVHEDPAWSFTWDKENKGIKEMPRNREMIEYYQQFASHVIEKIEN